VSCSRRAQSLVEFALIAPVVILLAMAAWDGGSVLREQVVLQQAARDGARAAATAYGPGAPLLVVQDAVLASAADLPGLTSTPGYLSLSYPDAQSVNVRLQYAHALITPVLRQLWGGGQGTVTLSASATFYLPQLTPVPATIVPSTPIPTATATPTQTPIPTVTPTPTRTAIPSPTPTATPTPGSSICARNFAVPPLENNSGYYATLQLTVPSVIAAGWTINESEGGLIELSIYAGNPFAGVSNPTPTSYVPAQQPLFSNSANANSSSVVSVTSLPQLEPAGTYSVFFFKQGVSLSQPSTGVIGYQSGTCA
jgi:hypothetical protein